MTTERKPRKWAAEIHAWADGEVIQWRENDSDKWSDDDSPAWDLKLQFRIKPEPREWWIFSNGSGYLWSTRAHAEQHAASMGAGGEVIRVREILE